jgi:hypothetical protein
MRKPKSVGDLPNDSDYHLGRHVLRLLVETELPVPMVKREYQRLGKIHEELCILGFRLVKRDSYGPEGGFMLFYGNGRVLVRVKTRGSRARDEPHLSISIAHSQGGTIDYSTLNPG